ncbi:MAG: glycoside hydrolase family 5 protein [candidate division KSB1 bacterium]|nr:glycoside hydrolase family 5 protein [candidate division KSB1 bacterium]
MKGTIYGVLGMLIVCSLRCGTSVEPFEIHRGTNISHWLSQSDRRGEARRAWFTESDVQLLDSLGFDHIRIPVDEEQLWTPDGEKEAEAFELLHAALDWCAEYGLSVIVDLHILRSHHFNEIERPLWQDSTAQDRFVQCWRDLSDELKDYPVSMLAYELFNEPVAEDADEWNRLYQRALGAVREQEPNRMVVVGSNRWQSVDTFSELEVPQDDPNIILSFHFIRPCP